MTSIENGSCPITMYLPPDAMLQRPSPDLLVSPLDLYYSIGPWLLDSIQGDPSSSLSNQLFNYINTSLDHSSEKFVNNRDKFMSASQGQVGSVLLIIVGSILTILPLLWIICTLLIRWLLRNKLVRNYLMYREYLQNIKTKQKPSLPFVNKYVVWFQVVSYLLVTLLSILAAVAYFLVVFTSPTEFQMIGFRNIKDVNMVESTGDQDMDCAFNSYIVNSFSNSLASVNQDPSNISEMYFTNSGLKNISLMEAQLLIKPLEELQIFSAKINITLWDLFNSKDCGDDEKSLLEDDIYVLNLTSFYMEKMIILLPSIIVDLNDSLTQGKQTQHDLQDNLQYHVQEQETSYNTTRLKIKTVVDEVTVIATSLNQWTLLMASTLQENVAAFYSGKSEFFFILEYIFVGVLAVFLVTISTTMFVVLLWRKTKSVKHFLRRTKLRVISAIWYVLAVSTMLMFILAVINFSSAYSLSTMCSMLDLRKGASDLFYSYGPSYSIKCYDEHEKTIRQRDLWQDLPTSRTIYGVIEFATPDGNVMNAKQIFDDLTMESTNLEMCSTVGNENLTLSFNEQDAYLFEEATKHFGLCQVMLTGKMKHNGFLPDCVLNKEPTKAEQLLMELRDFTLGVQATYKMALQISHVLQSLNGFDPTVFKDQAESQISEMFSIQETFMNQSITAYMDQLYNVLYKSDSVLRNYQNPVYTYCNQYRPLPSSLFLSEGLLAMLMLLILINLRLTQRTFEVEERQLARNRTSSSSKVEAVNAVQPNQLSLESAEEIADERL